MVGADGCLVGLVTSNARHAGTGAILPNLNFCLATEALRPLWALLAAQPGHGARTGSALQDTLRELDVGNEALKSVWALSMVAQPRDGQPEQAGARLQRLLKQRGVGDAPADRHQAGLTRSRL